MADAFLKGGPCDGKTVSLTAAEADTGEIVCGGHLYRNPETGARHNGAIIFNDTGTAPGPGGVGGVTGGETATHAHKGWNDIQRSVNRNLPTAVSHMARLNRAALRALPRRRKVRR
jgi:hypothetical protein